MRKIQIITLLTILTIALSFGSAYAADNDVLTKGKLADILIKMLNVKLPKGTDALSEGEAYEVTANALAVNGVVNFIDTVPGDKITYGEIVDILYALIGGKDVLDINAKIKYLVERKLVPLKETGYLITLADAKDVLNNPAFTALVAEAYQPAAPAEGAARGFGAPGVTRESPASQI